MTDVVSVLSKLSLMLQKKNASVAELHHKLDSALTVLLKYKNKYGPKMRQLPSTAAMTGISLDPETEDFKNFRREVIHKLEESLLHRFSDMAADVLSACKIADFKSWPE